MGICHANQSKHKSAIRAHHELVPSTPNPVYSPYTKRVNALNKILKSCKKEEQHWIDVIDNFTEYDEETKECIYIISYWSRKFISKTSPLYNLHSSFNTIITMNIMMPFYEPEKGLFDHSRRAQYKAQKLWATKRLKWLQKKIQTVEDIKTELKKYENDWKINNEKKKHWRCQLCKNYNIQTLFIEQEKDTSYDYNYKREVNAYDFQNAYNIMLSCKTPIKHHTVYILHNLRKYEVVKRFVMHRCRVCNHNHVLTDNEKYKECDKCHHPFHKHDQIWCKHADEFDGSEVIKTKRFKDINGNW